VHPVRVLSGNSDVRIDGEPFGGKGSDVHHFMLTWESTQPWPTIPAPELKSLRLRPSRALFGDAFRTAIVFLHAMILTMQDAVLNHVPLLDVARQYQPLRDEILAAIANVCDSGRFVHGPECGELERRLASYCHVKHAIGCASGSDALLLALMALDIGPDCEVIVPSFTFFATASAVHRVGATPVFVDIEPATFNIDPRRIEDKISPKTRAIIPVHLFGQAADMDPILRIARRYRLSVIEDAAQSIGGKYGGHCLGAIGDIGCFSFYPTKNLGGFGDGGMLTTSNDQLAARLRDLRNHGMNPRYYHHEIGINSRLDTLQAAVLTVKLRHLDSWASKRTTNADQYQSQFRTAGLAGDAVVLPVTAPKCEHVWNQYTIRIPHQRRDELRAYLTQCGVGTEIYYPVPLHLQKCFQYLGYRKGDLPVTELAAEEVLSLPIFPELTPSELRTVVVQLGNYFRRRFVNDCSTTVPFMRSSIQQPAASQ
jgi:dTDP-4-amino-4,6-dideoxygalactose transaminase